MYNFTPIDFPDGVDLPVTKRPDSRGFDLVDSRFVIGDIEHITRTNGQIEHLFKLMDAGGARENDLLVDVVIGRDGRLGYLNQPFMTESLARASWINLGTDSSLSSAGAAFVSRFGTGGLGRSLLSKAHICHADQGLTDAQFESSSQLSAAIHQQACCPWDQYPFNPLYGAITNFWHGDFGFETCPGDAFQGRWACPLRDRVRALLRAAQTGIVEDFTPLPDGHDPAVGPRYPADWTEATARQRFGELQHCALDGTQCVLNFDPHHVICCEWLRLGWLTGDWPEASVWIEVPVADGQIQDLVIFAGGRRLVRYGQESPWRWERATTDTDVHGVHQEGEVADVVGT